MGGAEEAIGDGADDGAGAAGAAAMGAGEVAAAGDVGGEDVLADGEPTVTSGVILPIVAAETPAFDKSATDEYGRPEIIFFAVASPTPGNSFNSAALALLRSTFPPLGVDGLGLGAADVVADDVAGAALLLPTVTKGVIFLIVAAETPAFDKSLVEENGRPAIIFFAVAAPTPGKLSRSCSLALFRSTFVFALACFSDPARTGAVITSASTTIAKNIPANL